MTPLVILPTYNEIENLPVFIPEVFSAVKTHILIIDDNSPDGTGELAERLSKDDENISVLHRPKKLGLGSAYVKGFLWALEKKYDPIIQMDSDFSHSPSAIPKLISALDHADFAVGSRYIGGGTIENWPGWRLAVSEIGNVYARTILGVGIRDLTGGFKAWKRKTLESLPLSHIISDGYSFQVETTFRAMQKGFKPVEVPITFRDRTRGKSKISRRILFEAMWTVWRLKFSAQSW